MPHGPLHGFTILDLTAVVLGPVATQILGDYGADIIKVEPPAGDTMRSNGTPRACGSGHGNSSEGSQVASSGKAISSPRPRHCSATNGMTPR
jgi:crotonobetainyl-CoA:carnitine CoA-transferase CaiB-like acyl-CoA transferase